MLRRALSELLCSPEANLGKRNQLEAIHIVAYDAPHVIPMIFVLWTGCLSWTLTTTSIF